MDLNSQKSNLERAMRACLEVFSHEPEQLRPRKEDGTPGGLIQLDSDRAVVLVPDLHGRFKRVEELLSWRFEGVSLIQLLDQGQINLIFCGDFVHAEARAIQRWKDAQVEYENGFETHEAMDQEMEENIATWIQLASLKSKYRAHVHLLKGNHENIMDVAQDPNRNFRKFAFESKMTMTWCQKFLGAELVDLIDQFERSLPLIVRGENWVTSHAQPDRVYGLGELIEADPKVAFALTWTRQGQAANRAATGTMENLLGQEGVWFAGHSAIRTRYQWNEEESLLLFHNPDEFSVIHLTGDPSFDPEVNVITLPKP